MLGDEEWLRRCLEKPLQPSETETGRSGPEVCGAEERSNGRTEAAPMHEEEGHGISRKSRKARRPCSSQPPSQRRSQSASQGSSGVTQLLSRHDITAAFETIGCFYYKLPVIQIYAGYNLITAFGSLLS